MEHETDVEFVTGTSTRHDALIELPGHDLDAVVHPFDAAERVLAAAS